MNASRAPKLGLAHSMVVIGGSRDLELENMSLIAGEPAPGALAAAQLHTDGRFSPLGARSPEL